MLAFDPLTALKNRDYLHQEVKDWFSCPDWSCLQIDADRFKRFNDYYGLPAGDARLIATARMLRDALPGAEIYRSYKDEFYCLFDKSLSCATELARQIICAARDLPMDWDYGKTIGGPVCVAVAHVPTHAENWSELSDALSAAMYEAKFRGCGQVVVAQNKNAR